MLAHAILYPRQRLRVYNRRLNDRPAEGNALAQCLGSVGCSASIQLAECMPKGVEMHRTPLHNPDIPQLSSRLEARMAGSIPCQGISKLLSLTVAQTTTQSPMLM